MSAGKSITKCIAQLKIGGDDDAQRFIWDRYFLRLVELARRHLGESPRTSEDEEDVAICSLNSFFGRVEDAKFPLLRDRENLWPLLAKITSRKAINQRAKNLRQKRGGGQVRGESAFLYGEEAEGPGLEEHIEDDLTPQYLAEMNEECQHLLELLPEPAMREIARKKLEGYTNAEIAEKLDVTERTVERKLNRVRHVWSNQLN